MFCAGVRVALCRSKKVGLVGLDEACELSGLYDFGQYKEAVTPAECSALGDVETVSSLIKRQLVAHGFGLPKPLATHVQSRQVCAGECIEGLATVATLEALQPVRRSVLDRQVPGAVRAG